MQSQNLLPSLKNSSLPFNFTLTAFLSLQRIFIFESTTLAGKFTYLLFIYFFVSLSTNGQEPTIRNLPKIGQKIGNIKSGGGSGDSLQHRDRNEDSLTIYYRYPDTARRYKLDSSVNDFT